MNKHSWKEENTQYYEFTEPKRIQTRVKPFNLVPINLIKK